MYAIDDEDARPPGGKSLVCTRHEIKKPNAIGGKTKNSSPYFFFSSQFLAADRRFFFAARARII